LPVAAVAPAVETATGTSIVVETVAVTPTLSADFLVEAIQPATQAEAALKLPVDKVQVVMELHQVNLVKVETLGVGVAHNKAAAAAAAGMAAAAEPIMAAAAAVLAMQTPT